MNYRILYVVRKRGLNIVEETMCEGDTLPGVIGAMQNAGYTILAVFSTREEF